MTPRLNEQIESKEERDYLAEAERMFQGDTTVKAEFQHMRALYNELCQMRTGYTFLHAALLDVNQKLAEAQQLFRWGTNA